MTPDSIIQMAGPVVSLPDVCVRVNEIIDDPAFDAEDIGEVIAQDTGLSARLLRLVNSAFYGFPGRIDTLSRAVTLVGTIDLRDLAVMTAACQMFTDIPPELINMETFWRYSVTCGVTARALARKCNILHPERLFTMGVLHDIGRLLILRACPQQYRDILLMSKGREDLVAAAEKEMLGFTHCEVGSRLLSAWNLPRAVVTVVGYHHSPELCRESELENALVHIGAAVADIMVWQGDLRDLETSISPQIWKMTGLQLSDCIDEVEEHAPEIRELYGILVGGMTNNPIPEHRLS